MKELKQLMSKYKIKESSLDLLLTSLTHSSYANEHSTIHNERLEFLGDAVLSILVSEYLYENYPDLNEGDMSKLRARTVCEEANAEYAKELNLGNMLRLGHGEELGGGRYRNAVLNDAFEAMLGAIYLTEGLNKVRAILKDVVFPKIGKTSDTSFIDYKSKLQEYVQSETREALVYREIKEEGKPHEKTFTMAVFLDGVKLGVGTGKSKKAAEQLAAKQALDMMSK